uniref:(northern house mosquito) hypothetical protein n=1 Tax=Culex pipiens TaxID=7175 RepID=A0A8D8KIL1_CULPI
MYLEFRNYTQPHTLAVRLPPLLCLVFSLERIFFYIFVFLYKTIFFLDFPTIQVLLPSSNRFCFINVQTLAESADFSPREKIVKRVVEIPRRIDQIVICLKSK